MAYGLSLELSEIKAPVWRPVDDAKMADARKARLLKKTLSKKTRNRLWRRMRQQLIANPTTERVTRGDYLKIVRERLNASV